jgi:(p)ppGpp synthase/HD superfamily hydrolase
MNSVRPLYFNNIKDEKETRLKGLLIPDPHADKLWKNAISIFQESDIQILTNAYRFSKSIDYRHNGMKSSLYFPHLLRVASLSILTIGSYVNAGIIGLLHNVYETSILNETYIGEEFGVEIAKQIKTLTVDRNLQWDPNYKKAYYENINLSPIECRVVKIFDKIDNLFILNINPDQGIRKIYLDEVESYILPMIQRDVPAIYSYAIELIQDCYNFEIKQINKYGSEN